MSNSRHFTSPVHEWVAYILHELQAPLGRISKLVDELESLSASDETPGSEERTAVWKAIRSEADGAMSLTGAMASHFALDDLQPTFVLLNIDEVIQRILPNLESQAGEKEIELDYRPILADLYVQGERALLIGAVQNLVRNAIEYTPQYGFVGIEAVEVDGWVRVVISDSGPGIPEKYIHWLFEPGFRISPGDRGPWDGRGLGLAFVSRIVAMHGGRVSVESPSGEGSRFILELPVSHEAETPS